MRSASIDALSIFQKRLENSLQNPEKHLTNDCEWSDDLSRQSYSLKRFNHEVSQVKLPPPTPVRCAIGLSVVVIVPAFARS